MVAKLAVAVAVVVAAPRSLANQEVERELANQEVKRPLASEGVETDHIDAADDGGPRSAAVLLDPVSMATAWLGAEVDVACGANVATSVGADARWLFATMGARVAVGVALYPQRFSFRGIYVHPVVTWEREARGGDVATALGAAVTVGYAWAWPVGATLRVGGGVAYAKRLGDEAAVFAFGGLRPQIDGDVGWVF